MPQSSNCKTLNTSWHNNSINSIPAGNWIAKLWICFTFLFFVGRSSPLMMMIGFAVVLILLDWILFVPKMFEIGLKSTPARCHRKFCHVKSCTQKQNAIWDPLINLRNEPSFFPLKGRNRYLLTEKFHVSHFLVIFPHFLQIHGNYESIKAKNGKENDTLYRCFHLGKFSFHCELVFHKLSHKPNYTRPMELTHMITKKIALTENFALNDKLIYCFSPTL